MLPVKTFHSVLYSLTLSFRDLKWCPQDFVLSAAQALADQFSGLKLNLMLFSGSHKRWWFLAFSLWLLGLCQGGRPTLAKVLPSVPDWLRRLLYICYSWRLCFKPFFLLPGTALQAKGKMEGLDILRIFSGKLSGGERPCNFRPSLLLFFCSECSFPIGQVPRSRLISFDRNKLSLAGIFSVEGKYHILTSILEHNKSMIMKGHTVRGLFGSRLSVHTSHFYAFRRIQPCIFSAMYIFVHFSHSW